MAISIAALIIFGFISDYIFRKAGIPGLVGMLFIGIIMGPNVLSFLKPEILAVSSDLRMIALIVILLRAGFELSKDTLRRVGVRAGLLSFVPAIFECVAITFLGPVFLNLSLLESAILGSVLGAVSPAVVVPLMINFTDRRMGTKKGIPTLLMAASSIDDVFVIVIYSVLIGFYTGSRVNIVWKIAGIPFSIISGIVIGFACGWLLYRLFSRFNPRATKRLLTILCIAIIFVTIEPILGEYIPFAALLSVMAMGAIILDKNEYIAHEISNRLAKIWVFAEILLFTLVGAQVDMTIAWKAGLSGSIVIVLALVARSIGAYICLLSSDFTQFERIFIIISYLPKATVQAAIGGAPLIAMRNAGMDTQPGQVILAVAVLSIILTAPLGAWGISFVGNRVLEEDTTLSTVKGETVSEDIIAESIRAEEIMERDIIVVRKTDTLSIVFKAFSESEFTICPIIDTNEMFQGIICIDDLRPILVGRDEWEWLIAGDVYRPIEIVPSPHSSLSNVLSAIKSNDLPEIPIVDENTQRVVGILSRRKIERTITEKWMEMKKSR